ncbi:MAG: hypothetical protein KDC07_00080 [Chitinophagaceae bacterium]|nr:hypothetical protein [Chitinophagaceae bacterium]MCB9047341.1 hypothetical protein [Chitinophagales bacterium]
MRLLLTALCGIVLMGMYSCKEDFTVAAPYRNITIVSGILDRADSVHYIRIQKAFMDENGSAIDMSKVPDSSFYPQADLVVTLNEWDSARTKITGSVVLNRVDMNQEGANYVKEPAISEQQFFTMPNYAYKFENKDLPLNPRRWYQMIINNKKTGLIDSSDLVGIVNSDSNRYLDGFYIQDFTLAVYKVAFTRTTTTSRYRLFTFMPRNGRMVEGYIRFNYVDKDITTGAKTRRYVDYKFDEELAVTKAGSSFELSTLNSDIYGFLYSSIGPAPENIERYMDSCDLFIYAASPEIYYYKTINLGQAGGLTGDNIQPNYTNFKGSNVLGVLGSRGVRTYYNAAIEKVTLDSLMINPTTESLRIRGVSED